MSCPAVADLVKGLMAAPSESTKLPSVALEAAAVASVVVVEAAAVVTTPVVVVVDTVVAVREDTPEVEVVDTAVAREVATAVAKVATVVEVSEPEFLPSVLVLTIRQRILRWWWRLRRWTGPAARWRRWWPLVTLESRVIPSLRPLRSHVRQ